MSSDTPIPMAHFNEEVRRIGRPLMDAQIVGHGWRGDEYGIQFVWPDGHCEFIGFGIEATEFMESLGGRKH
jgi:hypothetical protein